MLGRLALRGTASGANKAFLATLGRKRQKGMAVEFESSVYKHKSADFEDAA